MNVQQAQNLCKAAYLKGVKGSQEELRGVEGVQGASRVGLGSQGDSVSLSISQHL